VLALVAMQPQRTLVAEGDDQVFEAAGQQRLAAAAAISSSLPTGMPVRISSSVSLGTK
jgi:hypothetical protein